MAEVTPAKHSERGSTLLIVLVITALISTTALAILEAVNQQSRVQTIYYEQQHLLESLHRAEGRVKIFLSDTMPQQPTFSEPVEYSWQWQPSIQVEVTIHSLNDRFNLNLLNNPGPADISREITSEIFQQAGYPRRTVDELLDWITEDQPSGHYAPYGYGEPGRDLAHLDELALVSGFIQPGIRPPLRQVVTVYGSGNLNVHQLDAAQRETIYNRLPDGVREAAQQAGGDPWEHIPTALPLFTEHDDSVAVTYRLSSPHLNRSWKSIYTYQNNSLQRITRFPVEDG